MKSLTLIRTGSQFSPLALTCYMAMGTWSPAHIEATGAANGRLPCSALKYTSLQIVENE